MKYLKARTPFLDYANQSVMPLYILHQSTLLATGYFVVQWAIPDMLKWAIIFTSSFAAIMFLYEVLIRPIDLLRILFDMKPQKREKRPAVQPARS
jgi:hypothetical protein